MNRQFTITALRKYDTDWLEEKGFIAEFLDLLRHPNAYQRSHLPGHMTGSAWIVNFSMNQVLLTHHAKLNKWLQPGGHADGDEDILRVALREAEEETGLRELKALDDGIFDIDIHPIPARKEFPQHLHYDIRFLLQGDAQLPLVPTNESLALSWIPVDTLGQQTRENSSILRMAAKVKRLFGSDQQ